MADNFGKRRPADVKRGDLSADIFGEHVGGKQDSDVHVRHVFISHEAGVGIHIVGGLHSIAQIQSVGICRKLREGRSAEHSDGCGARRA